MTAGSTPVWFPPARGPEGVRPYRSGGIRVKCRRPHTGAMAMQALQGMDGERTERALRMLYSSRKNEFKDLAETVMHVDPVASRIAGWERFVLNFCMDVSSQFGAWSGRGALVQNSDLKALTLLRQLAGGKTSMNSMTRQLNTAYDLAEEFKVIYSRID